MKSVLAFLACLAFSGCTEYVDRGIGYRGDPQQDGRRYDAYDPVCGAPVDFHSPFSTAFDGRMYYFHDRECMERFLERPEAYTESTRAAR